MSRASRSTGIDGTNTTQWAAVEEGRKPGYSMAPSLAEVEGGDASLRNGLAGPSVERLQELLNRAGIPVGADGFFGPNTAAAVKKLQAMYGVAQDGVVTSETLELLYHPDQHEKVGNWRELLGQKERSGGAVSLQAPAARKTGSKGAKAEPPHVDVFPVGGGQYNIGWDKKWQRFDPSENPLHNSDYYRGEGPNHEKGHLGVDIFGPKGAPILSPVSGTVLSVARGGQNKGNTVIVEGGGYRYYMTHLDSIAAGLKPGDSVAAGTPVGTLGNSGTQTQPHLHFSIFRNTYTDAINPFKALMAAHERGASSAAPPPDAAPEAYAPQSNASSGPAAAAAAPRAAAATAATDAPARPEGKLRRMTNRELNGQLIAKASEILKTHYKEPYGTEIDFEIDGKHYVARLEQHENEVKGKHKGVSLFVVE